MRELKIHSWPDQLFCTISTQTDPPWLYSQTWIYSIEPVEGTTWTEIGCPTDNFRIEHPGYVPKLFNIYFPHLLSFMSLRRGEWYSIGVVWYLTVKHFKVLWQEKWGKEMVYYVWAIGTWSWYVMCTYGFHGNIGQMFLTSDLHHSTSHLPRRCFYVCTNRN